MGFLFEMELNYCDWYGVMVLSRLAGPIHSENKRILRVCELAHSWPLYNPSDFL